MNPGMSLLLTIPKQEHGPDLCYYPDEPPLSNSETNGLTTDYLIVSLYCLKVLITHKKHWDSGFTIVFVCLYCLPLLLSWFSSSVLLLTPLLARTGVTLLTLILIPLLRESSFTYYRSRLAYYIFRAEISLQLLETSNATIH